MANFTVVSGGTDRASGSRFTERMLTVVATCWQQGRRVADIAGDWHYCLRG